MKTALPTVNVMRTLFKLSIISIAAAMMTACNRDTKTPPEGAAALPATQATAAVGSPTATSVGSAADQHLADALANLWGLIDKVRDGEKSLVAWSQSDGDADPAMNKGSARFKQALRIVVGERSKKVSYAISYGARYELLVELLEKQQPEFGKKWRDGKFDPVLLHSGFGPIVGKWGNGPLPADEGPLTDGSMTVEQANQTLVDFCLLMDKEYIEPGLRTLDLEKQIGETAGPEVDRCFLEAFHVSVEQWLCGQGPVDFDYIAAVRQVLARYHPELAGPVADFFTERMSHEVRYAQGNVKSELADIATAEQQFVEHSSGGSGSYWTADLAGLYRYQLAGVPVRLIKPELARLDARPANLVNEAPLPPAPAPNENNLPKFAFAAVRGADGAALEPHHYAFCAWPLGYGRIGRQTYLLVDPGKVFVKDTDGKPLDRLPADLEADGWTSVDLDRVAARPEQPHGG